MVPVKPPVGSQAAPGASASNPAGVFKTEAAKTAGPQSASAKNTGFEPASLRIPTFNSANSVNLSQLNISSPLSQLASSLGLPQDNLTFTLLTFARAFSLPLESMRMVELRKEILAFVPSSPKTGREKARVEAFSLASVAAAAKGLKLSQEALGELAAVLGDFSGENGDPQHKDNQHEEDKDHSGEPQMQTPSPAELRVSFEKFSDGGGLLGFMNTILKKNEQNWVIWPFKMSVGGIELRVFVRLLIEEPFSLTSPGLLMVDITGPKRHWRFFLEKSPEGKFRVRIGLTPGQEHSGLKALEREAAKALGSFFGSHVQVLNGEVLLADFMASEAVPSINEEV